MGTATNASRFAGLTRGQAVCVVLLTAAAAGAGAYVALTQETLPLSGRPPAKVADTDAVFYRHVVTRIRAGEGYYDAVAAEFKEWDYQPTALFNWRTPLYAWVIGKLPQPIYARVLLGLLALVTAMMAYAVVERDLDKRFAALLVLLIGPFAWCALGEVYLFTELWAGVLIALSVCAYALGRWPAGLVAGLLALFFRELALPYCLIAVSLAVWQRRGKEVVVWAAGLVLYGLFFAFHAHAVALRMAGAAPAEVGGWVHFGGPAFVIGTTQMNVLLVLAPAWVAAVLLPLSLLGLAGWRGETGWRLSLTVLTYLAAFAVVGLPNNAYWGLLITPLLALGWVALPPAARDLSRALAEKRKTTESKAVAQSALSSGRLSD
jgi:hypothetical protein